MMPPHPAEPRLAPPRAAGLAGRLQARYLARRDGTDVRGVAARCGDQHPPRPAPPHQDLTKEPIIRLRVACIIAVLWSLTACAVAEAKVTLRVAPTKPTAVDDLVVRFKTDRNLKPGVRYFFELFTGRSETETCQGGYLKRSNKRPRKGRTMMMRLRAVDGADQNGDDTATTWCAGAARLSLYTVKGSGGLRGRIATKRFRISSAPGTDGS